MCVYYVIKQMTKCVGSDQSSVLPVEEGTRNQEGVWPSLGVLV